MDATVGRQQFCEIFKDRAVVVTDLPAGHGRDLACRANAAAGNGDASLRTKAEYLALFGLLAEEGQQGARPDLVVRDDAGRCPRSRGGGHASAQCSRPLLGLSSGKSSHAADR